LYSIFFKLADKKEGYEALQKRLNKSHELEPAAIIVEP